MSHNKGLRIMHIMSLQGVELAGQLTTGPPYEPAQRMACSDPTARNPRVSIRRDRRVRQPASSEPAETAAMNSHSRCCPVAPSRSTCALVAGCLLGFGNLAVGAELQAPQPQAERSWQSASQPSLVSGGATKKGFAGDIEELTTANANFRQVLYTGEHLQLVLMSLGPGEEIGEEVHSGIDQFIRVEQGRGQAVINGVRHEIQDDSAVVIPAGARHNVVNTGGEPLKLYTIYGPPEHRDGVVRATKAEAVATDDHFDGKPTE